MTDESRKKQIEKALEARDERPAVEQHRHPLPWRGHHEVYFPVVNLPLDVPLLNAGSHRIRAELEASAYDFVVKERTSERAQAALAELWKRAHRKFDELKQSLDVDGQTEPGVITRGGVLINGNTRLIALRELKRADRQWIRVAVLDSDATPLDIAQLELRLQVREDFRDPYRLSNELLFIEELSRVYGMSDQQIALALGWHPARPALGEKKVQLHRRIFLLVREMQRRDPKLPITFFDDEGSGQGKLEQLKALEQKYGELIDKGDTSAAGFLLETWLVVARSGFSSVHHIRPVLQRDDFVAEYLLPRLCEQEIIGERAELLVQAQDAGDGGLPGLDDLGDDPGGTAATPAHDLRRLLRLVESKATGTITLPGGDGLKADAGRVKELIAIAVGKALKDSHAEDKAEDALAVPADALGEAVRHLKRAKSAYSDLRGTKQFQKNRGAFEYQLNQARKALKALEDLVAGKTKAGR